jgi:hypothetical protein
MSVETELAEVKQQIAYLTERIGESILHSKEICTAKHKDIDLHLLESPRFRDMIIDMAGRVTLLTAIVLLLIAGILSITWKVLT